MRTRLGKKDGIVDMAAGWDYNVLKSLIKDERMPAMLVDLNSLDYNISKIAEIAGKQKKKVRIASKSIRVPDLLKYIFKKGGPIFQGIMCYSVKEAEFLSSNDFDDLLIAYPIVSRHDIETCYKLSQSSVKITMMVDCFSHVDLICEVWKSHSSTNQLKARICIDHDMSWKPAGLHMGAYRSPVRTINEFAQLFNYINTIPEVSLVGVMGYEAQIAGMGEKNPFSPFLNPAKKIIKNRSIRDVTQKRKKIRDFLEDQNYELEFFNGGGSGSLKSTSQESWITELTAGSGFLQSHIFDYYRENENRPAFCFALQVTRIPQKDIITCQSGGFIASGERSQDKAPIPFLPEGLKVTKNEGLGEVQTPLIVTGGKQIELGDPIFFRPSKAGEIAERFKEYILFRDDKIIEKVSTYRGLGKCFY